MTEQGITAIAIAAAVIGVAWAFAWLIVRVRQSIDKN